MFKMLCTLSLFLVFSLNIYAAQQDWANQMFRTYVAILDPFNSYVQQIVTKLQAIPEDAHGWFIQRANTLLPERPRHQNESAIIELAELARTKVRRNWFEVMEKVFRLQDMDLQTARRFTLTFAETPNALHETYLSISR